LFLGAGAVQYATHTKDLEKLGGLIKKMPVTAIWVLCFSLAISAIVPFNGFISEWLIYQALFLNIAIGMPALNILSMLSIAALGLVGALAAACFVKLFGISFLGRPRSAAADQAAEVPLTMNAGMAILGLLCLLIGLLPGFFVKFVDPVVVSLGGISISGRLQGWLLTAATPAQATANGIAPLEIVIVLAVVIVLALGLLRIIGGKYVMRKYGTWDCGFEALNARMQYSATGFSKPLRIVFSILYRPGRKVVVEKGASDYFPAEIKYKVWTEPVFEKYLYDPALRLVRKFSWRIIHLVQTGSVHAYLIYIFVSVLALMLYNRLA
jgi:NADH:ubiquinone oxidoreductase subunit 5 (subunit L)/multisubunit Na+/H+ antiporter MnhA subunit